MSYLAVVGGVAFSFELSCHFDRLDVKLEEVSNASMTELLHAFDISMESCPRHSVGFLKEGQVTRNASFLRYPSRYRHTLFLWSSAPSIVNFFDLEACLATLIWPPFGNTTARSKRKSCFKLPDLVQCKVIFFKTCKNSSWVRLTVRLELGDDTRVDDVATCRADVALVLNREGPICRTEEEDPDVADDRQVQQLVKRLVLRRQDEADEDSDFDD
jgi:hypothetical protein